jgi:hypothetical protein
MKISLPTLSSAMSSCWKARRRSNEAYRAEVAAAQRLGIPFALVEHDALAHDQDPLKAVLRHASTRHEKPRPPAIPEETARAYPLAKAFRVDYAQ